MIELLGASFLFVGSHFMLSTIVIREGLIAKIGLWPFRGLYSLIAIPIFLWMLMAYGQAPGTELWQPHMAFRHLAVSIMPLACILLLAGYTQANPTAMGFSAAKALEQGPYGVFRITRHPILWGIGLWAVSHLLANATTADFILFGAFSVLSIGGAWHMDVRKGAELGEDWIRYCEQTSSFPFAAILGGQQKFVLSEIGAWRIAVGFLLFFALMMAHKVVIGISPLPMPTP